MENGGVFDPPPERAKALSWSLQEVASTGAYIVSLNTVEAVQQVLKVLASSEFDSNGDHYQALNMNYDAAEQALKIVRTEAHRDLEVEAKQRQKPQRTA